MAPFIMPDDGGARIQGIHLSRLFDGIGGKCIDDLFLHFGNIACIADGCIWFCGNGSVVFYESVVILARW